MSDELSNETSTLPPLRLHHFFAWIAVTAVLLAISFGFGDATDRVAKWWIISWLPGYLGGTLAMTVAGFGLSWHRKGLAFPSQPGHWITLVWAIVYCVALLGTVLFSVAVAISGVKGDGPFEGYIVQVAEWHWHAYIFISICLWLWLAWLNRSARRWQVFFVLNAVAAGDFYVERLYHATLYNPISNLEWIGPALALAIAYVVGRLSIILPAIALMLAAVWDHREGIRRHWSHWAGIIAWCSMVPGEIITALVNTGWLPSPMLIE